MAETPLECQNQTNHMGNIIARTMNRLQMDYHQVLAMYPVEIWIPQERMDLLPPGWPQYKNVGPVISLRLAKGRAHCLPARYRYSSYCLTVDLESDGLNLEIVENTAVQHALNLIPEAQDLGALE